MLTASFDLDARHHRQESLVENKGAHCLGEELVAYALGKHSSQWNAWQVVICGLASATFVDLFPMSKWAKESEKLSEAFARLGLTTIPGVMLAHYITFVATVALLYLNFDHGASPDGVWGVTGAIGALAASGIILPHLFTFKKIRGYDVQFTLAIWAGLIAMALYRLYG